MSGFELFDHLTAQDGDSVRQQASRVPNSVYLRKPFVAAVLLEAVSSSGAERPGT